MNYVKFLLNTNEIKRISCDISGIFITLYSFYTFNSFNILHITKYVTVITHVNLILNVIKVKIP